MNQPIFEKHNVSLHEYNMHNYISHLNIVNVPIIIYYNEKKQILKMEKIPNMSISDFYGEEYENVPNDISEKIRNIIQILKKNNIIYPDITGYNFIDYMNKIWIIDFEHSKFGFNDEQSDSFVNEFSNGLKSWNPAYK